MSVAIVPQAVLFDVDGLTEDTLFDRLVLIRGKAYPILRFSTERAGEYRVIPYFTYELPNGAKRTVCGMPSRIRFE